MSVPSEALQGMMAGESADEPLMPDELPAYGPPSEDQVWKEFQKRLKSAERHSREWRDESKELYDFVSGKQWSDEDHARNLELRKPEVTFNVMQKFLDAVMGLQINNRQEIRCYPRTTGKVRVSEIASGAIQWTREKAHIDIEESDAGQDLLLTGMGWMEHFYEDAGMTQGHIAGERRDPIDMFWDPEARRKNLIDRKWQIRIRKISSDAYFNLFGEEPVGSLDVRGGYDEGKLEHVIKPEDYTGSDSGGADEGMIKIADYQWCTVHHYVEVQAVFPGGVGNEVFSMEEWRDIEPRLKETRTPYEYSSKKRKAYYRAWMVSGGVKGGVKELPYGFTYQAITGKRERNRNLWYGLGRGIKDPQMWVNKFFSSIIWQLSVNPKGGLMMEDDAVEDVQDFEDSWADPSAVSVVKSGALTAGKVQPKPVSNYPAGMDKLMMFSMDALPQVSGINAELLGMTDRQQPGIVEYQRKQGALAIVAWFFDALRRYYQEAGELTLAMIRDLIADGRLIRIVGEEGAQYVPLLRDPLAQEHDVIVDEAPTSVNMQERVFAVLQQMVPLAINSGMAVPKEVLDYVPLPSALAEKWKASLQPDPQQAQMKQAAAQVQMRQETAKAAKDESSATLNQVKAQEIAAKTPVELQQMQVGTLKQAAEAGRAQAGM